MKQLFIYPSPKSLPIFCLYKSILGNSYKWKYSVPTYMDNRWKITIH